jgi:hypothetical protein
VTSPGRRSCWNLFGDSLQGGFRGGANLYLNYSTDFRRAVYVPAADSTPPTVSCSANPSGLWPPNRKLRDVNVAVSVTDAETGAAAGFTLVSVTSNEPNLSADVEGLLDGTADTAPCRTTVTVPQDRAS